MKTFINVAQMKLATLQAGQFVETGGYYVKGDAGQAKYLIVAAQAFDGKGDHELANGTVAVLQLNGNAYNPQQFGARLNTDDSSYTEAMQAIVNISGNPASLTNQNTAKIKVPEGTFYLKSPIYIDSLDGLEIEHAGLFNTTIKVSSSFAANSGTVPATFPSDGLDYTSSAYFVVARRRNTGKTGAFIVPGQAAGAGAAWYYKFGGFYIDAEGTNVEKAFDIVRAPEIANLWMQDIIGHKIRNVVQNDTALFVYSSTFDRIQAWYSVEFMNSPNGTSLLFNECGAIECDKGWTPRANYSTYNSCTVDICGIGEYSWDLGGIGVVMNACGSEFAKGGIFRALTRGTEITVNGGFFLGGISDGEPNYTNQASETDFGIPVGEMIVVDGAKVRFNGTVMRNITEAVPGTIVHMNCTAKNGGRVTINGNTGEDFTEYVQTYEWLQTGFGVGNKDLSRVMWIGENSRFSLYTTADEPIARNGTTQIQFNNLVLPFDLGPAHFDTTHGVSPRTGVPVLGYITPMAGVYEFTFSAFINNIDPGDYIYFLVSGQPNRIMVLNDFPDDVNIGKQITLTDSLFLSAGVAVDIYYRTFSSTVDPVIISGARFYGGIVG